MYILSLVSVLKSSTACRPKHRLSGQYFQYTKKRKKSVTFKYYTIIFYFKGCFQGPIKDTCHILIAAFTQASQTQRKKDDKKLKKYSGEKTLIISTMNHSQIESKFQISSGSQDSGKIDQAFKIKILTQLYCISIPCTLFITFTAN